MRNILLAGLVLLAPALLLGQLESNTLTITASQTLNPQPDQALFYMYVNAGQAYSLNDVLTALQGSGITASKFSGVSTFNNGSLQWSFNLAVPLANIQTTVASLLALQKSIANGFTLSFSSGGLQTSAALLASETCSVASLISAAQAQAQNIANAAGLFLGPIVSLNTSGTGESYAYLATAFALVNELSLYAANTLSPPNCSIVVRFQLLH